LKVIIRALAKPGVRPGIGIRAKLYVQSGMRQVGFIGRPRSPKVGLPPSEMLECIPHCCCEHEMLGLPQKLAALSHSAPQTDA